MQFSFFLSFFIWFEDVLIVSDLHELTNFDSLYSCMNLDVCDFSCAIMISCYEFGKRLFGEVVI